MVASNDLNISQAGFVTFDGTATFFGRTLLAGPGISITNANGVAGSPTLSASGLVAETLTGNTGIATSSANNINVFTANTTLKFVGSGSTLIWDVNANGATGNIVLGSTLPSVTSGTENLGFGYNSLNALTSGANNTYIGRVSGQSNTSGGNNCCVGDSSGGSITTSVNNTAIGASSLQNFTTGSAAQGENNAIGYASLFNLGTGIYNIALGYRSGFSYTTSESSNINIGNSGTISESNVIHIGTQGTGAGQQNACYIAGIVGVTASNPEFVTVNSSTGQLGIQALTQYNVMTGGASNALNQVAPSATSGVPLISQGAASQPVFGTALVAGGGTGQVTLTNHGVLVGAGTSAITQLATGSSGQVLQSGGASADPSYSTATYPSTAGTAGKVLISDGTNIVSSTPTFPNASATSGKFIRSDGTNWIASTPTLPTTAGTASTLLRSDGTNFVNTTATYPTTAGSSGNFIKSDGTNFSSAALPSSSSDALALMNTTVSNTTGDGTVYEPIIFDTSSFDVGSNYSVSTGLFTAPSTGKYLVTTQITFSGIGVAHTSGDLRVYVNGATFSRSAFNPAIGVVSGNYTVSTSIVVSVTSGQTVAIGVVVSGSTKTVGIQGNNFGNYSWMSVTLLGS